MVFPEFHDTNWLLQLYKYSFSPENSPIKLDNNLQNSENLDLKVIKSRIADLSPKIVSIIENINFFEISKPIFIGNNGYTYVKCDKKEAKSDRINYKKIKQTRLNKYFLIYSEKLIKRLKNDANILFIEKIK